MVITRKINGQKVQIKLTQKELFKANSEFVKNWMKDVLMNDYVYTRKLAENLAVSAYDEYCKGNGLTQYECIEKIVDEYEKNIN